MFAETVGLNGSFGHLAEVAIRLAAAFGLEDCEKLRVPFIAIGHIVECANEALRCALCRCSVQVQPERLEDFGNVPLEAPELFLRHLPRPQMRCVIQTTVVEVVCQLRYSHVNTSSLRCAGWRSKRLSQLQGLGAHTRS